MKIIIVVAMLFASTYANAEYYPALEYRVFGGPASPTDKNAIDQLMERMWSAWSSQDAKGVALAHTPDAEWVNAFGRSFRGREDIQAFLGDRLFPMFDAQISKQEASAYQAISRRYIGSSAAVIYGRLESDRGSSVGSTDRKISFTFILQKIGDEWLIAQQIITDVRERRGT